MGWGEKEGSMVAASGSQNNNKSQVGFSSNLLPGSTCKISADAAGSERREKESLLAGLIIDRVKPGVGISKSPQV